MTSSPIKFNKKIINSFHVCRRKILDDRRLGILRFWDPFSMLNRGLYTRDELVTMQPSKAYPAAQVYLGDLVRCAIVHHNLSPGLLAEFLCWRAFRFGLAWWRLLLSFDSYPRAVLKVGGSRNGFVTLRVRESYRINMDGSGMRFVCKSCLYPSGNAH